jgi:cytochrome P450
VNTIEAQINKSGGSTILEADEWLQRVTFDIIGDTGFGLHINAVREPDNDIVTSLAQANSPSPAAHKHRVLAFLVPRWALWNWPSKRRRELDHMVEVSHQVALPGIKARREAYAGKQLTTTEVEDESLDNQKGAHSDIIATLLRSPHADTFTDEFLVAQSATFLIAGQDTTSVATTWALHLLSKHPDIQSCLREEVRAHIPSPDDKDAPTLDAHQLESLPLLYAICNETLRLYAPVPQIRRTCVDPSATIQGHRIPVGMTVNASQWAIQRSKHIWSGDVLEFKPERFLKRNEATGEVKFDVTGGLKGDAAVYGNMPFGAGFRNCIGERFARAEFAALLAGLIGRLEWLPTDDTPEHVEVNWGIVTKPANGVRIKARKVDGW